LLQDKILADQERNPLDIFALFKLEIRRWVSERLNRRYGANERQDQSQEESHGVLR
jgi:hypothetical protein